MKEKLKISLKVGFLAIATSISLVTWVQANNPWRSLDFLLYFLTGFIWLREYKQEQKVLKVLDELDTHLQTIASLTGEERHEIATRIMDLAAAGLVLISEDERKILNAIKSRKHCELTTNQKPK